VAVGFLLALLVSVSCTRTTPSGQGDLVLVGGRVYTSPGDPVLDDAVVHVRDGAIVHVGPREGFRIPSGADVFDCGRQVVTAGFWNSHVHFIEPRWRQASSRAAAELATELERTFVRHGFTTVFDTGSPWPVAHALRGRTGSGEVAGPRILTVGPIVFPEGGRPGEAAGETLREAIESMPEAGTPEAAAAIARTALDRGVDGMKVYVATWWNDPPSRMPVAVVRAITAETAGRRVPVFAHPSDLAGIETALAAGVHVLAHTTPAAGPWPDDLADRLRQAGIALTPTLTLWRVELERAGVEPATTRGVQQRAVEQLAQFVRAGGVVLFGTDVGYIQEDDPAEEYRLMAAAGMDARQILASLTAAPAAQFGASDRGRVAAGLIADLVVLDGDPATDVAAFGKVARVVRAGRVIYSRPD
jgi:imidazolonepropionase-like amidohydrolase